MRATEFISNNHYTTDISFNSSNTIVLETISVAKYAKVFEPAIYNSIVAAIKKLASQINTMQAKWTFMPDLLQDMSIALRVNILPDEIGKALTIELDKIVSSRNFMGLNFNHKLAALGAANPSPLGFTYISLNTSLIEPIASTIESIANSKIDSDMQDVSVYPISSKPVNEVVNVYSSEVVINEVQQNNKIKNAIDEIIRVLLHELTHVLQQILQINKGINPSYRSYLSNPKLRKGNKDEFNQTKVGTDRWRKLYYASPEEIGAHATHIAFEIIKHYKLNVSSNSTGNTSTIVPFNTIVKSIPEFVKKYFNPATPVEIKIFNRYVKLVYKELDEYYKEIIANK